MRVTFNDRIPVRLKPNQWASYYGIVKGFNPKDGTIYVLNPENQQLKEVQYQEVNSHYFYLEIK